MNRSILGSRIDYVKAEREAERELDALYRPAVPMKHPRAEKGKLYLTNGTVVTPRPGVHPPHHGTISQGDVRAAAAYCPGVRLSDTPIAFGPFKGLTFGQVRALRKGDAVFSDDPRGEVFLTDGRQGRLTTVTSDTEGVRYLDRLLAEPWLYEQTRTRIALYLKNPAVQRELLQALGPVVRDSDGGVWPAGALDAGVCFPPYGDGDDGSLKPDDFSITGVPTFDPTTGRDSWNGGQFEEGPWRGQGRALWLRSGHGTSPDRADSDPTPGNWRLDDPVRHERGVDAEDEDAWVDMKEPADNDVEWDWRPEAPLTEFRGWTLGLDYLQQLERTGPCSHQAPGLAAEALDELCDTLKRRMGLLENGKFRWHPAIAEKLRTALADAVREARTRVNNWAEDVELEARAAEEEATARRVDRLRWRGLDTLGRKKRTARAPRVKVSKQRVAALQAQAQCETAAVG
jgi:hypothetical protein